MSSEDEWEEIGQQGDEDSQELFPTLSKESLATSGTSQNAEEQQLEIVVKGKTRKIHKITKEQRENLINLHKLHVLTLICNATWRNYVCDDSGLQSVLLSYVPQAYHSWPQLNEDAFKKRIIQLHEWFATCFTCAPVEVDTKRTSGAVDYFMQLAATKVVPNFADYGTLFIALCRSLGMEVRLIYAFKPIPFRFPEYRSRFGLNDVIDLTAEDDDEVEGTKSSRKRRKVMKEDNITVWCEILFKPKHKWISFNNEDGNIVNPAASNVYTSNSYVIACEQVTRRMKDITNKYSHDLSRTQKARHGTFFEDILAKYFNSETRYPEADQKEDESIVEVMNANLRMPNTIAALQNHPKFVLERHLKKYEVIHPKNKESIAGQIRGETIYKREFVHILHTKEKWISEEGRQVRDGEEPFKFVKSRSSPSGKKGVKLLKSEKELDEDLDDSDGTSHQTMVGLYGLWQTIEYTPEPIVNGRVPKNRFNNIDLLKPHMMPKGGVHLKEEDLLFQNEIYSIPEGVKPTLLKWIAKDLGIDFAEAVTGFDYRGGRSIPRVEGIVIAVEYKEQIAQSYIAQALESIDNHRDLKQEETLKKWERLVKKVLNFASLQEKYGERE